MQQSSASTCKNEMVNLVMVTTDYRVKDDYKSTLESVFNGLVVNRDFKSSKSNLVDEVNQLVANKTNNMIRKALDGPIDPNTKLIILNAFSFEGDWVHPFPKSLIIQRPFYGIDQITLSSSKSSQSSFQTTSPSLMASSVRNLTSDRFPFMTTSLRTNYAEIKEKDMKIIQLDYLGNASMIILLPNQRDSLLNLVRNLTVQEIDSYIESRLTQSDIDIEIPKFTFEVQYDLMERLENLRLSILRADYTGIAERIQVEEATVDKIDKDDTFIGSVDVGAEGGDGKNESNLNNKEKSKNSLDSNASSDDSLRHRNGNDDAIRSTGNGSSHSNTSDKKDLSRTLVQDRGHLSLTSAIHKSVIKVDEKGTKAAAFTGFGFHPLSTISGQAQFIADHPFLFFIRDRSKRVNIFTGAVNKLTG